MSELHESMCLVLSVGVSVGLAFGLPLVALGLMVWMMGGVT